MSLKLIDVSVVVLSEGNNPKLLNHDFLARNSIVPEDLEIGDLLVTPPFSQIKYKNGVQFIVETNRLHIKISKPAAMAWSTELPRMATEYLKLLPHVNYNGVGINFIYSVDNPPDNPFSGLINDGPWWHEMGGMTGAAVQLNYQHKQPNLNVKIEENQSKLVLHANFHHEFDPQDEQKRQEYINKVSGLAEQFETFAQCLPFGK